ncbi:hypothetical protein LUZ61_008291 [Rhynchospora tenuis]|uniref:Protein kinase domain-containing protein n=1 Tax=Rhynchospora tenuis TaxID=198213 RepID=A0AAD5ZV45_9POAL|nr:hypothetical protein LUZ61_008291 [Rhynchospora tenuis]
MATANLSRPRPHLLVLLLIILTASSTFPVAVAQDEVLSADAKADAEVLLQFKEGLADPTNSLSGWQQGKMPCNGRTNVSAWSGVICTNEGRVLGLQLEGMKLSGKLDLAILAKLPTLRVLSFANNNFEGSIPAVNMVTNLRAAFFSMNQFSGEIPADAFSGMGNIKRIHLDNNQFTGSIPKSLAELPKLAELRLDGNQFQGVIPELQQDTLQSINVSNNALEGKIPDKLAKMGADLFMGNKNLCGAPLQATCTSSPTSSSSSETPSSAQNSTSIGIIAFIFVILVATITVLFFLKKRRPENMTEHQFELPTSHHNTNNSNKKTDDLDAGPEISNSSKMGSPNHHRSGSSGGHEQGRLVFVVEGRQRFELPDLLKSEAEVLGSGSLGCAYKATLVHGSSMVVKKFKDMNRVGKEDFEEHMRRLGRLSHPNLLPLVAYYYRKDDKLLVTDYVSNRSLAHFLHGDRRMRAALDWSVRLRIVKGVARALCYLYEELSVLNVPHGHLKPSNVLLNSSFEPLLSDYALVPVVNQQHATNAMAAFRSPERRQLGRPSKKSDVWCLGHLILEILTGLSGTQSDDSSHHQQGQVHDLSLWVASMPEEEWGEKVIDADLMRAVSGSPNLDTVKALLRIALACCEPDMERRLEMKDAVEMIEGLGAPEGGETNKDSAPLLQRTEENEDAHFSSVAI